MRLGRETIRIGRTLDVFRKFEWFFTLLVFFSSWFTVSVVGFLRKDFGERYFGPINLFFGYTVVANFAFVGGVLGVAQGGTFSVLMLLCWLAFIGASIYHQLEIRRKNRAGQKWHTMYMGTSILPVPFSDEAIQKWIEPVIVFIAGLVLVKLAPIVSMWLVISAFSLALNSHLVYFYQRQWFLDQSDAKIEAENISNALSGKSAKESGGFVIAESNLQMVRKDPGLKAAFAALSSDVTGVLDATPGGTVPPVLPHERTM